MIRTALGSPTMRLDGQHVSLRPLEVADIDRMVDLANNEKVALMTARMPHPYVRKDARDFIVYANKAMILGDELALGIHLTAPLTLDHKDEVDEDGDPQSNEDNSSLKQGSAVEDSPSVRNKSGASEHSLIGVAGFIASPGVAEIGYWIGEPFWGKGLGGEAARMISDYIETCGLFETIHARVLPDNPASIRILERLGLIYIKDVTEHPRNREGAVRLRCYERSLPGVAETQGEEGP